MRFRFIKTLKFLLIFTLVASNALLGFPMDYFIGKLNESKIVDNLYRAFNNHEVVDRGGITIPTILKEALAADVAIEQTIATTDTLQNNTSPTVVFISDQVGYVFYVDTDGNDLAGADCRYMKTEDGGDTWSPTDGTLVDSVNTTDCLRVAVWYDQWTPGDTTGTYIHIATIDSGVDDVYYTQLNTANDQLSTTVLATTQGANTFTAALNLHAITKGTDGNLYMAASETSDRWIVRCTEYGEASPYCTNAGDWTEITNPYDLADDWPLLLPLAGGSIMTIRMDLSGNDYDYNIWNGSVWSGWNTIDTTSGENGTYDGHFGATVDKTTNDIYFVYVTDNGTLGTDDDIRTAIYSGGAWDTTNPADVLTNDSKGITNAKIALDQNTDDVYVVYSARTTPGTAATANVYWKKSTDGMASWGDENQLNDTADNIYGGGNVNIMSDERIYATWKRVSLDDLYGDTVADPPAPTLSISQPSGDDTVTAGQSFDITYILADSDDEVTAAFYYDADIDMSGGTAITSDSCASAPKTEVTCAWDTTDVTPGDYYVYGITDDGVNDPVSAISPGVITINAAAAVSIVLLAPPGEVSYGYVLLNTEKEGDVAETIQNTGDLAAVINIKTSDGVGTGATWIADTVNSTQDHYIHSFSTTSPATWQILDVAGSPEIASSTMDVGATLDIYLKIKTPQTVSDYNTKTITITLVAEAP